MNFLRRLFGRRPATPQPVASASAPAVAPPPAPRLLLAWQEMIDSSSRIAGYRLQIKSFGDAGSDATALVDALQREDARAFAERRLLLVPLAAGQWQAADFTPVIGARSCFLLAADVDREPAVAAIRAAGGSIGLCLEDADAATADLVYFDLHAQPLAELEQRLQALRRQRPGLQLLAEGVGSWAEHRLCLRIGAHFSCGGFAASRDQEAAGKRAGASRLAVLALLDQLRADADLKEIAATATRDPALVVRLLEMANSPLYGLSRQIAGIEEAVTLLGRDALYRWLSIALFSLDADGHDQTLLVVALCRAALLEALVRDGDRRAADERFLVGLLSPLDALLEMPMAEILARIRLPANVADALLDNAGPHARYLQLARLLERCRLDQAVILAGALEIAPATLIDSYRQALAWACAELDV